MFDIFGFLELIISILKFTVSFGSIIGRFVNGKHAVWEKIKWHFSLDINIYPFTRIYVWKEKEFSNTFANNRKVRGRKSCAVVIVSSFSVMKMKTVLKDLL